MESMFLWKVLIFYCSRHLIWLNSNTKLSLSCGGQKLKSLIISINLSWSAWNLSYVCVALESARDLDGVYVQKLVLPSEALSIFGISFHFPAAATQSSDSAGFCLISSHSAGCCLGPAFKQKVAKLRKLIQYPLFPVSSFFWLLSSTHR